MTDDINSITTLVITDKLQLMHSVEAVICSIHSLVNISRMRYVSNPSYVYVRGPFAFLLAEVHR